MANELVQKAKEKLVKESPFIFARIIQTISYGIFLFVRFLIQLFHDAIGR